MNEYKALGFDDGVMNVWFPKGVTIDTGKDTMLFDGMEREGTRDEVRE